MKTSTKQVFMGVSAKRGLVRLAVEAREKGNKGQWSPYQWRDIQQAIGWAQDVLRSVPRWRDIK